MFPLARKVLRKRTTIWISCVVFAMVTLCEIHVHSHTFDVQHPPINLDEPFSSQEHGAAPTSVIRLQSAVIVMLAQNSEMEDAVEAIRSLEQRFNHRFQYPVVFLNDQPWSSAFISALTRETSGTASFHTIPEYMWGFRAGTTGAEQEQARHRMQQMESQGVPHAGEEQYHNMCRFQSGFFYDHPALGQYDWYWRIEPDARFTCDIPYDPFAEMIAHNKTYGYTISLWEIGSSAPFLFRTIDDYRIAQNVQTGSLWTAMNEASLAPYPLRHMLMPFLPSRSRRGDGWNLCHFWSNFEIADLAFYRSSEYRDLFEHLDSAGGFHLERWGDAAVHSLALALFVKPEQLHYFEDFGYKHSTFQHCPLKNGGGRCDCSADEGQVEAVCLRRLRETVEPAALK